MLNTLFAWILSNPYTSLSLIISLIEIILRLKPTARNYSILDNLHKILNLILPNLKDKKDVAKAQKTIDDITTFKIQ